MNLGLFIYFDVLILPGRCRFGLMVEALKMEALGFLKNDPAAETARMENGAKINSRRETPEDAACRRDQEFQQGPESESRPQPPGRLLHSRKMGPDRQAFSSEDQQ
jgi:hypothetical protein